MRNIKNIKNVRRTFKAGTALFRIKVADGFQYRISAFSNTIVGIFWGLIEIVVLTVFFTYGNNASDSINGLNLTQSMSYIWLAQAILGITTGIDGDLMKKITGGDIGVELCRPLDLYWHWFARTIAGKVSHVSMRGGLIIIFAAILSLLGIRSIGLGLPYTPLHFVLFLVSLFFALLFSTAYSMFITAIRTGVSWGDGPVNLIMITGQILSGGYLPLQLWPDFMQTFLRVQPFASYLDTPLRLYVGSVSIESGMISIVFQIFWIIAFIVFGQMIMKRKIKNIVVQGG